MYANLAIAEYDPETTGRSPKKEILFEHYAVIGDTLNIAEAGSVQAGVPWLPPTKTVRSLRQKFYPPLDEFVRQALVGTNTTVLELYCDDLESASFRANNLRKLGIRSLPSYERFALSILLFTAVFCLCLIARVLFPYTMPVALVFSLLLSLLAATGGCFLCSDAQRRTSFHWIVYNELLRRRGLDQINLSRLRIFRVETKPSK